MLVLEDQHHLVKRVYSILAPMGRGLGEKVEDKINMQGSAKMIEIVSKIIIVFFISSKIDSKCFAFAQIVCNILNQVCCPDVWLIA